MSAMDPRRRVLRTTAIGVGAFLFGGVSSLEFTDGDRHNPHLPPSGPLLIAIVVGLVLAAAFVVLVIVVDRTPNGRREALLPQVAREGRLPAGADATEWLPFLRRRFEHRQTSRWLYPILGGVWLLLFALGLAAPDEGFFSTLGRGAVAALWISLGVSSVLSARRDGPRIRRLIADLELAPR